ncbi:MAG: YceD family protein [Anaerolineae bacterium]
MLAFNVAQLLKEGIGAFRQLQLSGELFEVDELNPGPIPVIGQVTLIRTIAGVLATGRAELTLERACRRCLEPVRSAVTLEVEDEFVPTIDVVTGRSLPVDSEVAPELRIDERHSLDLTEVLWQYAVAETTEPVYCASGCLGLCPYCGADLNLGPCGCKTDQVDPRLAVLAKLLGSSEEDDTIEKGEDE